MIALLSAAGGLVVGLLGLVGVLVTQVVAVRGQVAAATAAGAAATAAAEQVDLARLTSLSTEVARLDKRHDDTTARHAGQITALRNDHAAELSRLRGRVDDLERQRTVDRTQINHLSVRLQTWITYSRRLVDLLTAAGIEHPPPPESDEPH